MGRKKAATVKQSGINTPIGPATMLTPDFPFHRCLYSTSAVHDPFDPRVASVFDPELRILLTQNGWIDADTQRIQKHVRKTIESLPAVQEIRLDEDEWNAKPDARRVERCLSGIPLPGYRPIHLVRGISFSSHEDRPETQVFVDGPPVELLDAERMDLAEALYRLGNVFPGIHGQCLQAVLAAAICADSASGQPPILFVTGVSGAAKDQTLRIAASFLADEVQDAVGTGKEEAFWRRLASYCIDGRRFVHFAEFARQSNLLKRLLPIKNVITWRQHFAKQRLNRLIDHRQALRSSNSRAWANS